MAPSLVLERVPHRSDGRDGHRRGRGKESTLGYYLSLEHGSERDKVPANWRGSLLLSHTSMYGLSSFTYTLTGMLLLYLLRIHPQEAWLYAGEPFEALLWIWQGLISYKCDVIDLGVRSWSHPTDRISATVFTLQQVVKYLHVRCGGPWGSALQAFLYGGLVVGVWCFQRSCKACRRHCIASYRFWHISWHLVFPGVAATFYLAKFFAVQQVQCALGDRPATGNETGPSM